MLSESTLVFIALGGIFAYSFYAVLVAGQLSLGQAGFAGLAAFSAAALAPDPQDAGHRVLERASVRPQSRHVHRVAPRVHTGCGEVADPATVGEGRHLRVGDVALGGLLGETLGAREDAAVLRQAAGGFEAAVEAHRGNFLSVVARRGGGGTGGVGY